MVKTSIRTGGRPHSRAGPSGMSTIDRAAPAASSHDEAQRDRGRPTRAPAGRWPGWPRPPPPGRAGVPVGVARQRRRPARGPTSAPGTVERRGLAARRRAGARPPCGRHALERDQMQRPWWGARRHDGRAGRPAVDQRPSPGPGARSVGPELDDDLAAQAVGPDDPADLEQRSAPGSQRALSRRRCRRWPGRRPGAGHVRPGPDGLGRPAAPADHPAHVVGGHVQAEAQPCPGARRSRPRPSRGHWPASGRVGQHRQRGRRPRSGSLRPVADVVDVAAPRRRARRRSSSASDSAPDLC